MNNLQKDIATLKKKAPYVHKRFEEGTADISILEWIIGNIDTFKGNYPKHTVLKETRLSNVTKEGVHQYKKQ